MFSLFLPYIPVDEIFKAQCWEIMRCGVEKSENAETRCPAFPNYGRICWSVAGTLSETKVYCAVAEKLGDCPKCPFYDIVKPSCPGQEPHPQAGSLRFGNGYGEPAARRIRQEIPE